MALVTGGTSGVGADIARQLASEGAVVCINYLGSKGSADVLVSEINESGGVAALYPGDVTNYSVVCAMTDSIVDRFGGLNILINNAGVASRKPFLATKPDDWRRQIDTCLYGTINCCHAAAPHLKRAEDARIIGIIGDSSRVGESGLSIVAAARAGVIGLIKSLAREYGRYGVTANIISLGLVATDHDREWLEINRDKLNKLYPVGRLGVPGDIAPIVTILSSPLCAWVTGQVLSINGGYSMN